MTDQPQLPEGYALPPSQPVPKDEKKLTPEEIEREIVKTIAALESQVRQGFFELVRLFQQTARFDEAARLLQMLLRDAGTPGEKAVYFLTLGQITEEQGDFAAAVEHYRQAQALEPLNTGVWYLAHNNLGYSLNQLERYEEAERYCRTAIRIDPERHNAYKNLGVALEGLGRLREAADCYLQAFKAHLVDTRALYHLETMLKKHPEVVNSDPALAGELEKARQAYAYIQWLAQGSQ